MYKTEVDVPATKAKSWATFVLIGMFIPGEFEPPPAGAIVLPKIDVLPS